MIFMSVKGFGYTMLEIRKAWLIKSPGSLSLINGG